MLGCFTHTSHNPFLTPKVNIDIDTYLCSVVVVAYAICHWFMYLDDVQQEITQSRQAPRYKPQTQRNKLK